MKAALPANEALRLASLRGYDVLDTSPEVSFDDLALLASQICQTPVALVSLVDENRQWFKSRIGLSATETPRDYAFCAHAILVPDEVLEVRDARLDARFADNPLVTDNPNILFYAGTPLVTHDNFALGTLCVIDFEPRELSAAQKLALQALGRHVVTLLELRRSLAENRNITEDLGESEARFHDLVEDANDLIQICNMDGALLYANRAWCETLGYSKTEIADLTLLDIIHPDSLDHCMAQLQQVVAEKKLIGVEAVFQAKDGHKVFVEGSATCRIEDGLSFSTRSIFRDVTSQKHAKAQLQEITELQHAILENAGYSIISTTPDGVITSFNPAAERMLGYSAAEVVGLQTPALIHEPSEVAARAEEFSIELGETIEPGFEVFVAKARQNLPNEYEWTYIRKDGRHFPVILSVTALRNATGEITGFLGMAIDITERRHAEAQFRLVVEATPNGLVMINEAGVITLVNNQMEKLFGYTREELTGLSIEMLVPERFRASHPAKRQDFFATPEVRAMGHGRDLFGQRKDGSEFPLEIGLSPLHTPEGAFVLAAVVDITERKRAEQLLSSKNEELKGFAYTVSHDLKAPLRGISGYAQELERRHQDGLTERAQFCITQIITASHNLDGLIEDLLTYSRVDSEMPTVTEVDLSVLVGGIMRDRSLVAAEQGIEVTVNVPAITLQIWERGLHQVLTNLIDNAIKYSRNARPPSLSISVKQMPTACLIVVKDNGVGFDMKYHDRIFGLFNRLVRADEFEGTGAGLAIVSKLLDKLGGSIRAESELGQGATFFVELPVTVSKEHLP